MWCLGVEIGFIDCICAKVKKKKRNVEMIHNPAYVTCFLFVSRDGGYDIIFAHSSIDKTKLSQFHFCADIWEHIRCHHHFHRCQGFH